MFRHWPLKWCTPAPAAITSTPVSWPALLKAVRSQVPVAASVVVLPPALGMQLPPLGSAMVSFCCGEGPSNQREPL